MRTQRLTAKCSTSVAEALEGAGPSCAPTGPSSTRSISSATGGSTSTAQRLRACTASMTSLGRCLREQVLVVMPFLDLGAVGTSVILIVEVMIWMGMALDSPRHRLRSPLFQFTQPSPQAIKDSKNSDRLAAQP